MARLSRGGMGKHVALATDRWRGTSAPPRGDNPLGGLVGRDRHPRPMMRGRSRPSGERVAVGPRLLKLHLALVCVAVGCATAACGASGSAARRSASPVDAVESFFTAINAEDIGQA